MLSGGVDTAFAKLSNRFAHLRDELYSLLCPYGLLMLDIAARDLTIHVRKKYP